MDSVSDMHLDMMLMSYSETDAQAEVVSGTVGVPPFHPGFHVYHPCQITMDVRRNARQQLKAHLFKTLQHLETRSDFAG